MDAADRKMQEERGHEAHTAVARAGRSVRQVSNGPLVIKFGGTSVGEGAAFLRAARIAADADKERPTTVVVSAMAGTTDTLLDFARKTAEAGPVAELHRALADRHLRAARAAVSGEHLSKVEERVLGLLERLVSVIVDGSAVGAARRDAIASFGERLSAQILAGAISSLDVPSKVVAEDPIATDSRFGEAEVDAIETRVRCLRHVAPLLLEVGAVAVVPGYVGYAPDGSVTTLGRGGSDLSATVLGRALGSGEVWIFSDVDGVLSADPRLVPEASLMPRLSYREAGLFAGLGAKVLHPRTMEPAEEAGMEVRVRNTFDPGCTGTRVSGSEDGPGLRCAALRRKVPIEIPCTRGRRSEAAAVICIGKPQSGDLARGVRCLREAGIPLLHSGVAAAGLAFVVPSERAEAALRALHAGLLDTETRAGEVA